MLGINLIFAGFILSLNAFSYKLKFNRDVLAYANLFVGIIMLFNSFLGIAMATEMAEYCGNAGGVLFGLNYLLIFASHKMRDDNFFVFGFFQLFAGISSALFSVYSMHTGVMWLSALWASWAILWLNGFMDGLLQIKFAQKLTFWLLLFNGVVTTFAVGFLIFFEII